MSKPEVVNTPDGARVTFTSEQYAAARSAAVAELVELARGSDDDFKGAELVLADALVQCIMPAPPAPEFAEAPKAFALLQSLVMRHFGLVRNPQN